jgi:hypothetical protein
MTTTTDEKISKMKALTEPVVADLLQVLRNYRTQVQNMRTFDDFAGCRDSLAIVVELRDMLEGQVREKQSHSVQKRRCRSSDSLFASANTVSHSLCF